jgi:hypothetical protein
MDEYRANEQLDDEELVRHPTVFSLECRQLAARQALLDVLGHGCAQGRGPFGRKMEVVEEIVFVRIRP